MTKSNVTFNLSEKIDNLNQHLLHWRDGLKQLENEVKIVQVDNQSKYLDHLANLRVKLENLQLEVQAIAHGDPEKWELGWASLQNGLAAFRHDFMQTAERIREEEKVPLGWLSGFSEKRTHESAGWAEGLGKRPAGSEGWAEGFGKQGKESKGWAEGYSKN